jgi:hypothetical protein
MSLDFNNAPEQRSGDLIPENTIAHVHLTIRPGNAGEGGWLKRSKDGGSFAIDAEFTVIDGPHAKRKFWSLMTVDGTTDGHKKAAEISFTRIRAILESVRGIRPDEDSDTAKQGRRLGSYGDLDGMRFVVKIGIEKGKDGYKDKNSLAEVITPDKQAWVKLDQVQKPSAPIAAPIAAAAAASQNSSQKPAWA